MSGSLREKARRDLQYIQMTGTRKEANAAFNLFVKTRSVKHERTVARLTRDRDELLAVHDFPAGHWKHIWTTNPIESVFATVRNHP